MTVTELPKYQAGFSPVVLTCKGNIGEEVNITITDGVEKFSYSTRLIKNTQNINLAAYVQSLFPDVSAQCIRYTVKVNDLYEGSFYALRAAAQIGEGIDYSDKVARILTDFDRIDVYSGYPRELNVLAENGYYARIVRVKDQESISLQDGFNAVPVSCGDLSVEIVTTAAAWSEYQCQLAEESFFFTVHMGDRTAKLSGEVTLTVQKADNTTYTKAAPYKGLQDVSFSIPVEESIVGISITANGNLDTGNIQLASMLQPNRERSIQTVTLPLPAAYNILPVESGVSIGKSSSAMLHVMINQPIS